jgi:polar amino acid transport system permease protein
VFLLDKLELLALTPPGWGSVLLHGLANSLAVAGGGFFLGLLIGVVGAFGKLYGGPFIRDLLACYTTIIRAVPELVLIVLFFYAGSDIVNHCLVSFGYDPIDINGMIAGIGVIGIVQGAYSTEVLRGAIKAIPPGQIEAGRSYGMPPILLLRHITLPAMLPYAIPGLSNLWLIATKDTALLAVVGFTELTMATRQAGAATREYFLFFIAAGLLYLAVTLLSNAGIRILERRAYAGMPDVG